MQKTGLALVFLVVLFGGFCLVSAASPARIVTGFLSNALSALLKWLWSLTPATKIAIPGRSAMRFEDGYTVETVFDGSKLGIEPYSVEVSPSGEVLLLDSANSNIYRISQPLSRYSRPKLVAGSAEGYTGHVDGKPREARMYHPKALTVDDRGNIYVADTMNKAIRKISDTGVTTIAGGRWNRGGHVDGPSEDAKFSSDFEVVYIGSSCSLLVVDRGNQVIREIQLHFDDCAHHYGTGFPLGLAVVFAAGFFGYMLALLQRRVGVMEPVTATEASVSPSSRYPQPIKSPVRPPLIPTGDELEKHGEEEGLLASIGKLISGIGSSITLVFGGIFSGFRRKPQRHHPHNQYLQRQQQQQQRHRANSWSAQESFVVPEEEEPPPVEARTPTPRKTYAFMSQDPEKLQQLRKGQAYFNGWDGEAQQQQQPMRQPQGTRKQHHVQQHQQHSSAPKTYYEQSSETTNEVVFGAVQESAGKRGGAVEIKPVNYGDPFYEQYNLRARFNYMRYRDDR